MLFSEQNFSLIKPKRGSIEVICGSMFSGKTEELIRRLRRAEYAQLPLILFKPQIDTRHESGMVISHDESSFQSVSVKNAREILDIPKEIKVVGIDEAQFFDVQLIEVCRTLANRGLRVIVAGLDMDFQGEPFGPVPNIMAIAEHVTKVHAVCVRCGSPANFSFRKTPSQEKVVIGATELYEPRCRSCYYESTTSSK